jgi:hypothetical protein
MSTEDSSLSLSALFARALESLESVSNLLPQAEEAEALLASALADLQKVTSRVQSLALFSPNETLDDISDLNLVYLQVPYAFAEALGRIRTTDNDVRMAHVVQAKAALQQFIQRLDDYGIVPAEERSLYENPSATMDRRQMKMKQFQHEKEIAKKIESLQHRLKNLSPSDSIGTGLEAIGVLLKLKSQSNATDDEDEDDEAFREANLLLLQLHWAKAKADLEMKDRELELLRNASRPPTQGEASTTGDSSWKLDSIPRSGPHGKGPLLDANGRPLRPFTIVPSNATLSDRARIQTEVFRPDHRLPTMSIDEYLEIEQQRGNIISGGGPQSGAGPTKSEQLAIDSEQDGTLGGEEKSEQKRREDEEWAIFKEKNPKGAGNTMNRG